MKRREFLINTTAALTSAIPLVGRAEDRPCPPSAIEVSGGTSVEMACSVPTDAGAPKWMEGRAVNEWFQIPGTALSNCPPTTTSYVGRPSAKMEAWCGAALRRSGSVYLIGAAGGHADYSGNEVNALNLRADAPIWVELRPSSPTTVAVNSAGVYLDYRAAARHTYWAMQFINQDDRLVVMPKGNPMNAEPLVANTSANSVHVSAFPGGSIMPSFSAANWTAFHEGNDWDAAIIRSTGRTFYARLPSNVAGATGSIGCMNPRTGDLYLGANGRLMKWTRDGKAGSWSDLGAMSDTFSASAIDFTRGRMLLVGDYSGELRPRVRDVATGAVVAASFTGMGADVLRMSGYPGVVYDEANDRFLVFKNSSPMTIFTVNPASWTVSLLAMTGRVPPARPQGVNNAVQYVPELKGLVMGHGYSSDVYFMRLA